MQKIPPNIPGLPGIEPDTDRDVKARTLMTDSIYLLYSTADHYYVEGPEGSRMSLNKRAVEGVIWNPKADTGSAQQDTEQQGSGVVSPLKVSNASTPVRPPLSSDQQDTITTSPTTHTP